MSFLQLLSTIASIISVPLAIYYAHKTVDATNDKARLEIIKTLSYKLSIDYTLCYGDILSVYNSKLREHKIKKASFSITDIVHDLKSDIMSNAFIPNDIRSRMLLNLSQIHEPPRHPEVIQGRLNFFIYRFSISPIPNIMFVISIIYNIFIISLFGARFMKLLFDTYCYYFEDLEMYWELSPYYQWIDFYHDTRLYTTVPILIVLGTIVVIKNSVKRHKNY